MEGEEKQDIYIMWKYKELFYCMQEVDEMFFLLSAEALIRKSMSSAGWLLLLLLRIMWLMAWLIGPLILTLQGVLLIPAAATLSCSSDCGSFAGLRQSGSSRSPQQPKLPGEGWPGEAHLLRSANGEQMRSSELLEVQIVL